MALLVLSVVAFGAIVARLTVVQGFSAQRYAVFGESQRLHSVVLPAERGGILDRNMGELAISIRQQTVWADPKSVPDPAAAARILAPVLDVSESVLRERMSEDASFVYLARKVDDQVAGAVRALQIGGIHFLDEPKRFDPAGTLAAPVLGQVGVDDEGLSGLEKQYDKSLTGRPGELLVERDPGGNDIADGLHQLKPSARGDTLVLTIDRAMQYEAERALAAQIVETKAKGGIALVMDPGTGEVLAMANLEAGVNGGPPVATADNMAVTRVFEPGSVNKVVTIGAALEDGLVDPSTRMNVGDTLKVADVVFGDAEPHAMKWWTAGDILSNSSNVGTIQLAQRLGKGRIDRYLRAFGLADRSDLRFPGESGGLLPDPDDWSGTSIATVPIGQGVAVTALQMLGAYNTVANKGVYVAPSLVKATVDSSGKTTPAKAPASHRVLSEATAANLTDMLVSAVHEGTGTAAQVEGYTAAGKTGTARKPENGAYKPNAYVSSFVGFLPAESPRLSAIVVLDEPTRGDYFGGVVSAPVFASVASYAVRHFGIPPAAAPAAPGPEAPTTTLGASPRP